MHEMLTMLLDEINALWKATGSLSSFTRWPNDLSARNPAPIPAPTEEKILLWDMPENSPTSPVCHAVQEAALYVNWQFI